MSYELSSEPAFGKVTRFKRVHAAGLDFFGRLGSCGFCSPSLHTASLLCGYRAAHWIGGVCRPPIDPEVQLLPLGRSQSEQLSRGQIACVGISCVSPAVLLISLCAALQLGLAARLGVRMGQ